MAILDTPAVGLPPRSPDEVHPLFETLLNDGDLENVAALYESDAALVDRDGLVLKGGAAIQDYLRGLLSIRPTITYRRLTTIDAGDVAVLVSHWTLTGTGADGATIEDTGRTYDVIRRQRDGTWRIVVDNPWGGMPVLTS